MPPRRIAFIRVVGAYVEDRVKKAMDQMIKWAKEMDIYETETFFGMSLDDPFITPQDKYRYEVCITIPDSLEIEKDGRISEMRLPSCTYATTKISGDLKVVATANYYLWTKWLIGSGYEPEHQHGMEIFLDKTNVFNWDNCELKLCIPVKPINSFL
ncbi:GyrI-like domain-containing protein [Oligoflexaceae bacterium]|nr:GyrI-like domain-containing protein [Oligoflexaceae bacterium]